VLIDFSTHQFAALQPLLEPDPRLRERPQVVRDHMTPDALVGLQDPDSTTAACVTTTGTYTATSSSSASPSASSPLPSAAESRLVTALVVAGGDHPHARERVVVGAACPERPVAEGPFGGGTVPNRARREPLDSPMALPEGGGRRCSWVRPRRRSEVTHLPPPARKENKKSKRNNNNSNNNNNNNNNSNRRRRKKKKEEEEKRKKKKKEKRFYRQ